MSDDPAAEHGPIARLRRFLEHTGGFTLHHRTGEPARHGVCVCADPSATLAFPMREWDDARVGSWVRRSTERLRDSDLHLGGWLDPSTDVVWLDIVRIFPSHRHGEAVRAGRSLRQKAVFDLAEGRVLPLTGAEPLGMAG
ncbi:MAG: hypothetical protein ACXV5S_00770 [Acidimicrobiales bacterium]